MVGPEAYVNLMCGRFFGGGKKSRDALRETEKFRLDCASNGLIVAQLSLRPAAAVVDESKPLLAALDRFAVIAGERRALEAVMVRWGPRSISMEDQGGQ